MSTLTKQQRLGIIYQILEDEYGVSLEDWCDSDLYQISWLIKEVLKIREVKR